MKLLQRLIQTLSPNHAHSAPATATQAQAGKPLSMVEQLAPFSTLMELLDKRQLLELQVWNQGQARFSTMLLHLDFQQQLLWLDKEPGLPDLAQGDCVRLRHHQNGFVLDVECRVAAESADAIAVHLPTDAHYRRRRQTPRVSLRAESPLIIKLKPFYVPDWDGTVRDLSSQGARIALPGNRLHQLQVNQHIPWLEIPIADDFSVRCEGRISAYQLATKPYRHTCVSLVFEKLKPQTQRRLDQFVKGLLNHAWDQAA